MKEDAEKRRFRSGDATWIPNGSSHSLFNTGDQDLVILVIASSNWYVIVTVKNMFR